MEASEIVKLVLGIAGAVAQTLAAELTRGETSTLDTLRGILKSPDELALIVEAEIAAQRAKAARELRP